MVGAGGRQQAAEGIREREMRCMCVGGCGCAPLEFGGGRVGVQMALCAILSVEGAGAKSRWVKKSAGLRVWGGVRGILWKGGVWVHWGLGGRKQIRDRGKRALHSLGSVGRRRPIGGT